MTNNTTTALYNDVQEGYWDLVYAESQYKISKALGQYLLFIIFICGLFGNILSMAVMSRRAMRVSSTAYYMVVLATADTGVLIVGCLRRWVIEVWGEDLLNVSPPACFIVNFLQYWSFDAAVWILVAMTVDRVIVVTHPLKAHLYATKIRASLAIGTIAFLCAGLNMHIFFTSAYDEKGICTAKEEFLDFYMNIWSWIDAAVYSFLPFIALLYLNIIIIVAMYNANQKKRRLTSYINQRKDEQRNTINQKKLTIMLLSVTFAFILLTAPAMIIHILREMGEGIFDFNKPSDMAKYILIRQISRILLYLNHSINFFLYCVSGEKFRRELLAMLKCQDTTHRYRQSTARSTVVSTVDGGSVNQGYHRSASTEIPE